MNNVNAALMDLNAMGFGPWVSASIVGGLGRASGEVVDRRTVHGALASPLCGRAGLEGRVAAAVGRVTDGQGLWRTWRDVAGDLIAELAEEHLIAPGDIVNFLIICDTFKTIAPLMNTQAKAVRHKYECGRLLIDMIYQLPPPPGLLTIVSKRTTCFANGVTPSQRNSEDQICHPF